MPLLYADVAIPLTVDKLFTYSVPEQLQAELKNGIRVVVQFGKRTVIGIIVAISANKPNIASVRSISDILDTEPILSDEMLSLARWISGYYFSPLGGVLKTMVVQRALRPVNRIVRLAFATDTQQLPTVQLSSLQLSIVNMLNAKKKMSIQMLQKTLGVKSIYSALNKMVQRGLIIVEDELAIPTLKPKRERTIIVTDNLKELWNQYLVNIQTQQKKNARQRETMKRLLSLNVQEISVTEFLKSAGVPLSVLKTLERKQLLTFGWRDVARLDPYDLYESSLGKQNITLNERQQHAVEIILAKQRSKQFHTFLLYGVTGSGKTQVYIETIRETLQQGKTAIVLVPEISLTPQIVRRFKLHFGDKVVVLHSRLSFRERSDAWRHIQEEHHPIVIGPRSAVFAPLKNIGLIIVDEEHEASYKQFEQTPRYHARDVAIMRAHNAHAVVVLGSATPSLESYTNALNGKYSLLELPERVDTAQLPKIELVNMAAERQRKFLLYREKRKLEFKEDPIKARTSQQTFEYGMISDMLKEHIVQRLKKREGIILLHNRRGFAPIIECLDCGKVDMCDNCNITLTYHLTKKHLRCHYCGLVKQPPEKCSNCKGTDIQYRGFGTQRVEEELSQLFPEARLLRMDLDTTSRKGAHDKILRKFSDGEADILLGTQMVSKGLDFPRVTLVGVISADTQMLLPDFRSAERTFQLLTQVSGRAGRSTLAGEVVIQTFQPTHYSLQHVLKHDFTSFYHEEIAYRKELLYPPFSRLVLVECKGKHEETVIQHAAFIANLLKQKMTGYIVLGPSPAAITKINKQFRWHIVIKDIKSKNPSGSILHHRLKDVIAKYYSSPLGKNKSINCVVDIDPVGMM